MVVGIKFRFYLLFTIVSLSLRSAKRCRPNPPRAPETPVRVHLRQVLRRGNAGRRVWEGLTLSSDWWCGNNYFIRFSTVESTKGAAGYRRRRIFVVGTRCDFAGEGRRHIRIIIAIVTQIGNCFQYICDKYAPDSTLYPSDPQQRAIVNHRLCFNSSFFYSAIAAYAVGPIFFDYPQTEMGLKRVHIAVGVFEEYFKRLGKKNVAGDDVTIADISLVCSMTVLEAIKFDFTQYPLVDQWYRSFKSENAEMWHYAGKALEEVKATSMMHEIINILMFSFRKKVSDYATNPPDMSKMNHPLHPMKKK